MLRASWTKKSVVAAAAVGAFILAGSFASPAMAAEDTASAPALTAAEQTDLTAFWTENGVDAATQDALLATIDAGGLPQSVIGGAEPTAVTTTDEAGTITTRQVYPDGSVTVSSTEYPYEFEDGQAVARDITGCDVVGGSGFASRNNCNVSGSNGVVSLGFIASYTLVQGGYDYITNHHTPLILLCGPGTCSDPGFTQFVEKEGINGSAGVTMTTVYSAADFGSISNILNLEVGNDSASTSFSPGSIG